MNTNMDDKDQINQTEPEEASAQTAPEENTASAETAKPEEAKAEAAKEPAAQEKESKPKKSAVKEYFTSTKFKRGGISTAFTAGFLVVIILLNVVVSLLGQRFPSINIDLTKNNMNTLSEQAIKVVDKVKEPVTISIMATEEQTRNDQILAGYGLQYSQVGTLAAKMAERNSNIKVEYIDLVKNPTFANTYKDDNLTTGDIVIKSSKRHRVLTYTELFDVQYGQDGSTNTYSMVDSALASGLNTVISDTLPVVAFDTGHGEQLDTSAYKQLLTSNNFENKDFNLLTDEIPEKAQLIVIGCPTTDYTDEEIKKLDDFLSSTKLAGDRSLLLTFHPSQKSMPKLASFLAEWGIQVPQAYIVESDQSKYYTNDPSYILSNVGTDITLNSKSTDYGYFSTPQSNPIEILFQNKGTKSTHSLAKSNTTTYLIDNNTKETDTPEKKAYNTIVLSQDTVTSGDKTYKANVIAVGSTGMFDAQILGASTFGNAKYAVDLSKYATGTSNTDTEITTTSQQTNVADITLGTQASKILGVGVFTILIPLLIAIAGIVVFRKRRHL
ncbi:Gldg family protein [Caproiciproducens sp. LBM24188]|nr:hypothetical protein [Oscillospiraceae bacterium]